MPTTLIAGNWKMNGRRAEALALAHAIDTRARSAGGELPEILVCPPAPLLDAVGGQLESGKVALGGQDCHADENGAHTGDTAAEMLVDAGCKYVIVGHSERRQNHHEDNPQVWAKGVAAHRAGLKAIICVGETEAERDRGEALAVVRKQVEGCLPDAASAENVVVAYEPIWAIGTGRSATPEDVAEVHDAIRAVLTERMRDGAEVRILYGGSVKPGNARELLAVDNVNGALVGGASLDVDDFWAIIECSP